MRRAEAVGAGAQDRGVAGLEAERAGIRRHVRPALEDHADDPERRRRALDLKSVRALEGGKDPPDGIGQRGDAPDRRRDRLDARRVQSEAVEEGGALAAGPRLREVVGVRGEDCGGCGADRGRHRVQRRVLLPFVASASRRCGACAPAELGHEAGRPNGAPAR